ncbi:MAG: glycoside hydrolase family 3 C-terminal domain-containing protein [Oscillospiraceae bacterium]|jgi:beta-glucosidase-like glycosyl hydrolase|nr:glycoside hydrolase family 3 C-terminal domain-containing protein [Oscillospiraceae bacterium]
MQKNNVKKLLALAVTLIMIISLFSGFGVVSAADPPEFPAIYPESAIKPLDWDDPRLDALAWGVVNALTTVELYDLQGGSNTTRGRNTGVWEDSYTWGTGYVHMVGALGVPVMRFWDGPQGVVTVGHFDTTLPPSEPAAAATWDRDAMYKYGTSYGRDNKASSANVQLGSQIDVIRSTHFSRSRDTLSEDAYLGAQLAVQFVKGMEDQNVAATLKHVAGYNFNTGTNRDVRVDEQTFHENWMAAPRAAIVEGGASAIMTSYNRINLPFYDTWAANDAPKFYSSQGNAFYPQVGIPNPNAIQSEKEFPVGYQAAWDTYLLKDTLRNMYGYQGLTMTDWGGNTTFSGFSGTTLETGTISRNTQARFEEAIDLGYGTLEDVRLNAYYNLKAIGKLGYLGLVQLDDNGVAIRGTIAGGHNSIELAHPLGQERYDILWENEALNLEVETKGAVLLKNENNALPLKDAAGKKIAVIGLSGQYALTSHYSEASAGWVQAKFSPLEKIDELMPNSDVKGYIGVNDIVGEPIPADLLWSEIERPTQPQYTGDYDGVTAGVNFTVGDAATASEALTNTVSKILPDLKVLTGTNDYKNGPTGNGIVKGQAGRVVTYLKAPADGIYGFKILNIGGTRYGAVSDSRISLLGDDMEVESSTDITFTAAPNFGRGSSIPAGSGYGTSSDVATREGLNIPATFTSVTLIKDRWYKLETGMWTTLNAKDAQFQVNWLPGNTTDASRAAAVAAAGVPGTDVVFFAHQRSNGGSAAAETTNTLAAVQVSLLEEVSAAARAAGNKVIFVGNISLAVSMPWIDKVDAVLWMWLGGDTIGTATAQLLTGVVNPSGKTTITFPTDSQQSQFGNEYNQNANVASPGTYSVYFEGIYGGYKWYDWQKNGSDGVLFPFGYGLSYTTFGYSNLKVVPTPGAKYGYTVSVDVENTGDVAGGEAVQVYLSAPKDYVMPALNRNQIIEEVQIAKKALVQFDKVYLDPGEKRTVTMDVGWEQLMYWDINAPLATQSDGTKGKWQPVLGERTFMVGGSSANLPLSATVTVEKVVGEGELVAGIIAPAVLDTVSSGALSYGVTVSNVPGTNAFELTAKFDSAKLDYVDSVINIPDSFSPFFLKDPTYNAETGVYKAAIVLLKQGVVWSVEDPVKILTVNFKAKSGLTNNAQVKGELTSVLIPEVSPTEVIAAYAVLNPSSATAVVSNQWRFDVNVPGGDGYIDILDLSWVINKYYLYMAGDAGWADAQAFDANADGIVNLADILIISSYFAA